VSSLLCLSSPLSPHTPVSLPFAYMPPTSLNL
jgi:hypothetical protein